MFQDGIEETFTVRDAGRMVEESIIEVLAHVIGEINTDSVNGCSADANVTAQAGESVASCDVAVSSDDIIQEVNAVAASGAAVHALTCDGDGSDAEISLISRDIAAAVALAVVQADSFCESTGGPGTMSCGLSHGTVTAVARATASAFSSGWAEANDEGCSCKVAASADTEKVEEIVAVASASAMAEACTGVSPAAMPSHATHIHENIHGTNLYLSPWLLPVHPLPSAGTSCFTC